MHLILNHVTELQEVGDTYGSRLVETFTGLTVIQVSRAEARQSSLVSPLCEVIQLGTIEDGRRELHAKTLTSSTQDGLENLSEVHT